jgi:hypothetical protein
MAAVAAQEFMCMRPEYGVMSTYRCKYCGDWHLTKYVFGENSPDLIVIERDLQHKSHTEVVRNRKKRKARVAIERQRQHRQFYLGDDDE